jgi:hypothetical protein
MKKICLLLILIQAVVIFVPVAIAKTHKDNYEMSCDVLWPAVKDAIRNSGKYGIVGIDNNEMSISYVVGGTLGGKRINSMVLNRLSEKSCEMQTQTAYSGLIHNDAGDFKKRVDESVAKLAAAPPKPETQTTTAAANATPKPAENATPAPAATDMVKISVDPGVAGAEIELDGAFVGMTPSVLELKPGEYEIKIAKAGYKTWQKKIKAVNGAISMSPRLEKVEPVVTGQ